jgi:P27 family predicted phage terminase small subunit
MPGRKPKPTALKELSGNPGKRRLNRTQPEFSAGATCPKHLDKIAKVEWKRLSEDLTASGLLTSVDRAVLAGYCDAYSRWVQATTALQAQGLVITSPKSGYPMPNPYVSIANTSLTLMHKFAAEFGFTPSSRSRINVTQPSKTNDDAMTRFMNAANDTNTETVQ